MRESYYVIVVSRERFILRLIKISFSTLLLKSVQLYILIITIFFFLTRLIELNISTETTDRNYNFVEACKTNNRKKRTVCRLVELRVTVCE